MTILFPFILALLIIFAANKVAISLNFRLPKLFSWLMALLNLTLMGFGLVLITLPQEIVLFEQGPGAVVFDNASMGLILVGIGLWGVLSCWPPFRAMCMILVRTWFA